MDLNWPVIIATGAQKRGQKCSLPNKGDDAYKSLVKQEDESDEYPVVQK